MVVFELSFAAYQRDAGLREQRFHACAQLVHHLLLASGNGGEIHFELEVLQSVAFGLTQTVDEFCMMAEGFGRNATAVETGASHLCDFGNYHLQSVLGGIFCSPVTTGACSDND